MAFIFIINFGPPQIFDGVISVMANNNSAPISRRKTKTYHRDHRLLTWRRQIEPVKNSGKRAIIASDVVRTNKFNNIVVRSGMNAIKLMERCGFGRHSAHYTGKLNRDHLGAARQLHVEGWRCFRLMMFVRSNANYGRLAFMAFVIQMFYLCEFE